MVRRVRQGAAARGLPFARAYLSGRGLFVRLRPSPLHPHTGEDCPVDWSDNLMV